MKTVENKIVRCAIYTRKSTDEGLEQEFNSLMAQREAAEAYIASQKAEGWICLPTEYNDGGFTGGNIDRPALKKMIKDIENDLIDTIVVYKVDRLSRSLLDFAELIGTFDRHGVTFVSVTQSFNTTSSMGRLTLNILLSFAQFEREIIGERIRDKIAGAKKKGKHTGGMPILGYDIKDSKLIVNPEEAKTVNHIFQRFLVLRSPMLLSKELNEQGITTKTWVTKKGKLRKGSRWNKCSVYTLLTNRKYIGEITHHDTVYPGEQEAVVKRSLWDQIQEVFKENSRIRGNSTRSKIPALLKGLLKCGNCGGSMGITYTRKNGRLYLYYVCIAAIKKGYDSCPVKTIPAGDIEKIVTEHVREILRSPEVLAKAHLAAEEGSEPPDSKELAGCLQDIDAVWGHLFPAEQTRIFQLLLDKVILNTNGINIKLRSCGVSELVNEIRQEPDKRERA